MVNFQVHLVLIGSGSPWCKQVLFLLQLGPRKPLAPHRFLPALLAGASPLLLVLSDDPVCAAGDGIWCAQAQKEKASAQMC